jgi:hypothetical protein
MDADQALRDETVAALRKFIDMAVTAGREVGIPNEIVGIELVAHGFALMGCETIDQARARVNAAVAEALSHVFRPAPGPKQ